MSVRWQKCSTILTGRVFFFWVVDCIRCVIRLYEYTDFNFPNGKYYICIESTRHWFCYYYFIIIVIVSHKVFTVFVASSLPDTVSQFTLFLCFSTIYLICLIFKCEWKWQTNTVYLRFVNALCISKPIKYNALRLYFANVYVTYLCIISKVDWHLTLKIFKHWNHIIQIIVYVIDSIKSGTISHSMENHFGILFKLLMSSKW